MQTSEQLPAEQDQQKKQVFPSSHAELGSVEDKRPRTAQHEMLLSTIHHGARQTNMQALQAKMDGSVRGRNAAFGATAPLGESKPDVETRNQTGLPDTLKAGIESLSGFNMDHVRVHYNSAKPAQLRAHAYAQGSEIHIAPGKAEHLPHEAWHVVQQARGIVGPTMQAGGVLVNDDAALETEADVMGARAQETGGQAPMESDAPPTGAPSARGVAQRLVDPAYGEDQEAFARIRQHPYSLEAGSYGDITGWGWKAVIGNDTIRAARTAVEDDDDIALLDGLERRLDGYVRECNEAVVLFNLASHDERRYVAADLVRLTRAVNDVVTELNFYFRPAGGGFGALGRAAEVADRNVVAGARVGGPQAADRFINDTTLNGNALTDQHHVTGGAGHAHVPGPISIQVNGGLLAAQAQRTQQMGTALNGIPAPQNQQKAPTAHFVARDRGAGQGPAMANTNARGYAWFHQIPGWNQTRWEWLHLRGAGLGGATDGTNLVLGTYDANTQMIPYESNLRALQSIATASPLYTGVQANWHAVGAVHRHAYNLIRMTWTVQRSPQGIDEGAEEISGTVDISPLRVGEVLSKTEVKHIESALREVRNQINTDDVEMGNDDG
jgi:hypothetical protein